MGMLRDRFKWVRPIFVTGGSSDDTVGTMLRLGGELLQETGTARASKIRTVRLAAARNRLLDRVRELPLEPEYVAMFDMDETLKGLDGLDSCGGLPENWWGCCVNTKPRDGHPYYDMWALRTLDDWAPRDMVWDCAKAGWDNSNLVWKALLETGAPYPVRSCFGGFVLYKWEYLRDNVTRYAGLDGPDPDETGDTCQVCEHVLMHEGVGKRHPSASMYIARGFTAEGETFSSTHGFKVTDENVI